MTQQHKARLHDKMKIFFNARFQIVFRNIFFFQFRMSIILHLLAFFFLNDWIDMKNTSVIDYIAQLFSWLIDSSIKSRLIS